MHFRSQPLFLRKKTRIRRFTRRGKSFGFKKIAVRRIAPKKYKIRVAPKKPLKKQIKQIKQIRRRPQPQRRLKRKKLKGGFEQFDHQHEWALNKHPKIFTHINSADETKLKLPEFLKPVYVVSIRRNRMDGFVQRMGPWMKYMKRFKCVNGKTLNKQQLIKQRRLSSMKALNLGQIGCAESHIGIWREIANGPHEFATVFEDDIALNYNTNGKEIVERMDRAFQELESKKIKWEFLSWGNCPYMKGVNKPIPGVSNWKRPGGCQGFFAYTMKRSAAQTLLKSVYPLRVPIDVWFYNVCMAGKVVGLCLEPRAFFVIKGPSETSRLL